MRTRTPSRLGSVLMIAAAAGCSGKTSSGTATRDAAVAADAAGDAASAATCASPGVLFCDDFEATALGPATSTRWTTDAQSGALTIDAQHAYGTRALHVHTDQNGRAMIRVANFAPPDNSFFGRARIWVTAFPTAPDYAHFTLVEAAGAAPGVIRPIGGQYIPGSAKSLWGVGSDGGPTGDWTNWQTAAPAQAGRWLCMEWSLRATGDVVEVWIDGTAHPELTVSQTQHGGNNVDFVFPTFTSIWIGWWLYQGGPTPAQYDVWFDDVALATTRLGC